jgi:hypothetical protein
MDACGDLNYVRPAIDITLPGEKCSPLNEKMISATRQLTKGLFTFWLKMQLVFQVFRDFCH